MSSNKYLLFSVRNERYGIPIEKVREIIRSEPITPVHDSLEYVKGVINLRGKVIPVFDLKLKFGIKDKTIEERSVFIITDIIGDNGDFNIALIVSSAEEVTIIDSDNITDPPHMGLKIQNNYLKGIHRFHDDMVMLLNIDEVIKEDGILEFADGLYDKSIDS